MLVQAVMTAVTKWKYEPAAEESSRGPQIRFCSISLLALQISLLFIFGLDESDPGFFFCEKFSPLLNTDNTDLKRAKRRFARHFPDSWQISRRVFRRYRVILFIRGKVFRFNDQVGSRG